jgi:hypothetical protein
MYGLFGSCPSQVSLNSQNKGFKNMWNWTILYYTPYAVPVKQYGVHIFCHWSCFQFHFHFISIHNCYKSNTWTSHII